MKRGCNSSNPEDNREKESLGPNPQLPRKNRPARLEAGYARGRVRLQQWFVPTYYYLVNDTGFLGLEKGPNWWWVRR
jgi:hypothetical protein